MAQKGSLGNKKNWVTGSEYADLVDRRNRDIDGEDRLGEQMKVMWRFLRDSGHVCSTCNEPSLMQMWEWLDSVNAQSGRINYLEWELDQRDAYRTSYTYERAFKDGVKHGAEMERLHVKHKDLGNR